MRFIAAVAAVVLAAVLCVTGLTAASAPLAPARTVLAWGSDGNGQLGDRGSADSPVPVAAQLPAGTTVTAVAAGDGFSLALTSDGAVWAWGDNTWGQLGNGRTSATPVLTPVRVAGFPAGTHVTALAAGQNFSLALTSGGAVWAWGGNSAGQLGTGSTKGSDKPAAVRLPAGTVAIAIAAGAQHSLALTSGGAVWAWGYNAFGQLGDGNTTNSDKPAAVRLPAGTVATAVAGGGDHSLAVASGGAVWAWGYNNAGQLGNGSTADSQVPVAVHLPAGTVATAVAAGAFHSLALASGGAVWAWGDNAEGQLGDGGTSNSRVPAAVSLPAGTVVTTVTAGALHSMSLTSDGRVLAWGYSNYGQLGDGGTTDSATPVAARLPAYTFVTALSAGSAGYHSLALAVTATSVITLTAGPAQAVAGDPVTLSAAVACSAGTPTGTVTFLDGTATLGTVALSGASASLVTATLALGNHRITARYAGDIACPSAVSAPATVAIAVTASSTAATAGPAKAEAGKPVTLSAAVTCRAGAPTGAVTFLDGSHVVGTGTLSAGRASLVTTALAVGSHRVTARYEGSLLCLPSASAPVPVTVTAAVTVVKLRVVSATAFAGARVTMTVTVTRDPGPLTGTVTFLDGGKVLGTDTLRGGRASRVVTAMSAGSHHFTARYSGDQAAAPSASAPVIVTIASRLPQVPVTG